MFQILIIGDDLNKAVNTDKNTENRVMRYLQQVMVQQELHRHKVPSCTNYLWLANALAEWTVCQIA